MRRTVITGLRLSVAGLALAAFMSGCGWFGTPTVSVAFSEASLAPRATSSVADIRSRSATYEYNSTQIGSVDVASVQAAYEETGTYLGSYTPESMKIKGLTLGFGRSNSDVAFTVFSEVTSVDEYFDLMNPIHVSQEISSASGDYDLIQLVVPMDVSDLTVIQVQIPGYTSEQIYAFQSEVSEAHNHLWGTSDDIELIRYLGSSRFQLTRLYSTARQLVGTYIDEFGGEMSVMFPSETMMFRTNIDQSTLYSDMAGSVTDHSYLQGNTHLASASLGVWTDIPFEGFTIDERTSELKITFSFDTTDILELWEMNDAYLAAGGGGLSARYRVLLSSDFYERITVRVEQD